MSPASPSLAELQARFHALATGAADPARAEGLLAGSPALGPAERAGVYAGMYGARLSDALAEDFPRVALLLGHERFHELARDYLAAHPSDDPDIGRFGRKLPAFLAASPAGRPDLSDLAALEWARSEVLVEEDTVPAGRGLLTAIGAAEDFAAARLRFVPALRLLRLSHDALALWRALESGEAAPPPAPGAFAAAVWRDGFDVVHGALAGPEAAALEAALAGAPLGGALACFEGDRAAEDGLGALLSWVDEGWVRSVERG